MKLGNISDKKNVLVVSTNDPKNELAMTGEILQYEMQSSKICKSE